jgi:uncharacterized protein
METNNRLRKSILFALFLVCGISIFVIPLFVSGLFAFIYRIIVCAVFIAGSVRLRRNVDLARYFPIFFAFFIASFVSLFEYLLYSNQTLLYWISSSRMDLYVLFKVLSALLVVIPIVLLTKASRQDMASLYLTKGKLRLGLIVGIALFLFFFATSIVVSTFLYGGKDLTFEKLISWAPWIFVFVFANGIKEEVQFRGLFLKKYFGFFGAGSANLLQAIVFTLPHIGETYSPLTVAFLFIVFLLGLAFGAVAQKTNSLISSILFHAGTDIAVILGIFSNF